MGFGAGQIVNEDDLALLVARETYQEITTLSVTNSVALQTVPGSLTNVVAGATYWIEVWIAYESSTTGDARFAWATSSGDVSIDRHSIGPSVGITGANSSISDLSLLKRAAGTEIGIGSPGAATLYHEVAIVKNVGGSAGSVNMRFAQNTANATAATILSGYMKITRVA